MQRTRCMLTCMARSRTPSGPRRASRPSRSSSNRSISHRPWPSCPRRSAGPARGVHAELDASLRANAMHLTCEAKVAHAESAELERPLEGAGFALAASYRLDGDLLLDKLSLLAPDRGAEVSASGRVTKPLRL